MVQSLCSTFSPVLCKLPPPDASGTDPTTFIAYHSFPTPNQLRDPSVASKLRELGFGYRAEYVQRTAEMLCEEHDDPEAWLLSLREKGVQEAREELLKLCGVGPKVADCVLLMSMDKVRSVLSFCLLIVDILPQKNVVPGTYYVLNMSTRLTLRSQSIRMSIKLL